MRLNAGLEACDRMEQEALSAIRKADWHRARRLLRLRLEAGLQPAAPERQQTGRILQLIDEAKARGRRRSG